MKKELKQELAELKKQKQQLDYERRKRVGRDPTIKEVIREVEKVIELPARELTFLEKIAAVFMHKFGRG